MKMTTSRTHQVTVEANGSSIELGEVRWLLAQMEQLPDSYPIQVLYEAGNTRETGMAGLRASIPEKAPRSPLRPLTDSPQA